jgi:hypothetical protein
MAEKTFSIDLEEELHARARRLALDRKVPVKALYAEALTALLEGNLPYPYAAENRDKHEKLEAVLNSGDEPTITAVVSNIEVFFDRLRPKTPARKRMESEGSRAALGPEESRLVEEYRRGSYEKRQRMLAFAAKEEIGPEVTTEQKPAARRKHG